jgi:hypothetical protein
MMVRLHVPLPMLLSHIRRQLDIGSARDELDMP